MKILIIGDSCLDMFRYGVCNRLSPEAPVPIFKPTTTKQNGGMCINVLDNVEALGITCDTITNDIRPVKIRYVDEVSNQILIRVDENDDVKPLQNHILENTDFSKYDAVIISDYNKGFLSENDIKYISENHPLTFIDSKKRLGMWIENIKFIKINEKEFNENREWLVNNYKNNLIITQGKNGAQLNYVDQFHIIKEHPVRDLSGAGDTFLAALVVKYLEKNNINEAICFANKCASWVVTQKGVVAVNPNQI
jgi:D-beta-D-heptose 7-phosphate kinase / D-beta-D-heptose 1-phosphate adenosyltransferase